MEANESSVKVSFDDGSSCIGRLLVACDGGGSRVRRALFPQYQGNTVPVKLLGLKVSYSPEEVEAIRQMDPFFLQGTSSKNNTFIYISILDAPGNNKKSTDKYVCQLCISWPHRPGFLNLPAPLECPPTNEGKHQLIKSFAQTWAEPFRSLVQNIPSETEIKALDIQDFPPPKDLRTTGRAVLMGDALHAMAMYRGEGANHAIQDVLDFAERITPLLSTPDTSLRAALDAYEDAVVGRSRPAVLASRRACLDAHEWSKINTESPLLTRRAMHIKFDENV
jgi:2-polyprenyl-6-methoxyphenol hydroxylase-like FAD-dependent oxidoreductase